MVVHGEQQRTTGCSPGDGLKGFAATEAVAQWTPVDCWNFSGPLILHSTPVWLSATWAILVGLLDYERVDSRCARDWNWNVKRFSGGSASFCFSFFFLRPPLLSHFIYFFHLRKNLHISFSAALSGIVMFLRDPWKQSEPDAMVAFLFLLSSKTWIKTCSLFLYEY